MTIDRINGINELFTEHCSITMPAGQYLTIYKEIQRLENENEYLKRENESLKQELEVKIVDYLREQNDK